jgi:membrane associated rhomboid family serine protease
VAVDPCGRCGGLWFGQGELARVVKESVGSVPDGSPFGGKRPDGGLTCPACDAPLGTYEFVESDGGAFDVDLCQRCGGVWLDQGELERVQRSRAREVVEARTGWRGWLFQFLLQVPVELNLPPLRFPLVTVALVLANVIGFVILFIPPSPMVVVERFALYADRVPSAQWLLSLLTHQFLHGGIVHIALNMYFLYKLGDNVEDALGRGGYILFYLACGVAGGVAQTLMTPGSAVPVVGASGAISGLMAAYALFYRKARLTWMLIVFQFRLAAPWWVLIWFGLNVAGYLAKQQGIAWGAHLGGFLTGLALAFVLDRAVLRRNPRVRLLRDL